MVHLFYIDKWLIIIKLHCTLSSRLLGKYYRQVKEGEKKPKKQKTKNKKQKTKNKNKNKKTKWGFEILHGLFPSSRCILRDLFS